MEYAGVDVVARGNSVKRNEVKKRTDYIEVSQCSKAKRFDLVEHRAHIIFSVPPPPLHAHKHTPPSLQPLPCLSSPRRDRCSDLVGMLQGDGLNHVLPV